MAETFDWLKPSLLWQRGGGDMIRRDFFRPALHEFRTDTFMEDFLAAASSAASKPLRDTLAVVPEGRANLKFFQPVHGNFYLTSASLCCHLPGFPDREVKTGEGESVFFVLRKKLNGVEYAWNASETSRGWQQLSNPLDIPKDEERLPLFQAQTGQGRQLFCGYIPVSSQDTYSTAIVDELPPTRREDPRLLELDARFIGPLDDSDRLFGRVTPLPATEAPLAVQLRISVYMLLDLWEYFYLYLPEVATALQEGTRPEGKAGELLDYLKADRARFGSTSLTLADALAKVGGQREQLNAPGDSDLNSLGYTNDYNLRVNRLGGLRDANRLRGLTKAALEEKPETAPAPVALPKFARREGDQSQGSDPYVLRYVYERAQCDPPHRYVSRPTDVFELAPFFDPDAPGRPIRVGLPVDISVAGLRKFKKNVGFVISKELNKKLEGIAGKEKAVLDNEASVSDGGIDIGFICSFSLPIITLCAFILLMIIVILLNLVFWWIPFLKICLPIPLKAK